VFSSGWGERVGHGWAHGVRNKHSPEETCHDSGMARLPTTSKPMLSHFETCASASDIFDLSLKITWWEGFCEVRWTIGGDHPQEDLAQFG